MRYIEMYTIVTYAGSFDHLVRIMSGFVLLHRFMAVISELVNYNVSTNQSLSKLSYLFLQRLELS